MPGAQWDPTALPTRPGIYINFKEAAAAQISGGARGTVAIPLLNYTSKATAKSFYTVSTEKEASDQFGLSNITSVLLALQGGAKEVLVYAMPKTPIAEDYADMRAAFDARPFNVFVFDSEYNVEQQAATKTWVTKNREEGKHFIAVIGGDATTDVDPVAGNARTTLNSDDYIVNVVEGGVIAGVNYTSSEYAAWVAGKIAGTPINRSITYAVLPLEDVTKRMTNSEIVAALNAGSLVFTHDGEKVKIEQGLVTSGKKIRSIRARQAIATDIARTAADNYIGKLDNNADGQTTLMVAIKAYLETLEASGVLTSPFVGLDPQRPSVGDSVFLVISYTEVDSMERIFLTVNI
ncbi:phage tail sheath subtilisin-like domain-containing protein [Paenibacillus chibensis]|uniref:phage tail sheath subtilisin-like domain-containing protein n=1 Tax=Paenibacillus chibensis TaxID=59846 RepID=UPI000FDCC199|nr:phage tail sheath subtilisin-like domain-containing protein [Paenibacillus chibensis]MEC0370048.1 phage tail sheath subtilisin-like domain-containing protein [Paenibacillus chibensis]